MSDQSHGSDRRLDFSKVDFKAWARSTATKDGPRVDDELFPLPSLSMVDLLVPSSRFADPKSGEASGDGENVGMWRWR
jgi:hypothetical protein